MLDIYTNCQKKQNRGFIKTPILRTKYWLGCMDSNHGMQESKSCALPTWRHPIKIIIDITHLLYIIISGMSTPF